MTALGKLLRTTAFKLTLVYLSIFAVFAVFLLGYFAWNTRRLITEQITQTVDAEITGLAEQYRQGGIRRLVFIVEARSRRPGSSLYLLTTPAGEGLAGNVGSLSAGVLNSTGWERLTAGWMTSTAPCITRWFACFSCRQDSDCWSAAIWKSASACVTSCWRQAGGRWLLSSCWALPEVCL